MHATTNVIGIINQTGFAPSSVTVRVGYGHTDTLEFVGWRRVARGEYRHLDGCTVKRDNGGCWNVVGGKNHGTRWHSMHWAMYQAAKNS